MALRHKLLRISSRDRDVKTDATSSFFVSLNNIKELQTTRSVIVKQVSIPNTMYNITDDNRTFTYNIATVSSSFATAAGQYNTTQLITALQTAGLALGLAITQNPITSKLSFATTTNIEYLDLTENSMAEVLGIEYGTGSGVDVGTYSATGLLDLGGIKNIYIESRELGEENLIRSNGKTINIIAVVPLTVAYGATEQYLSQHSSIDDVDNRTHGGRNHQRINIVLKDSADNIIDLNGHHVEMVLKVYY